MDIYSRKSRWKFYLLLAGLVILAISMVYTNYIANRLIEGERDKVKLFARALENIIKNPDLNAEMGLEDKIVTEQKDIPIILVDDAGNITDGKNFPEGTNLDQELEKIRESDIPPIEGTGYARYVYYKHTWLLTLLTYFPIIQFLLLGIFVAIGYMLFSSARRSEQNQVWVGMAKETAHQLGTPITAIVGWIEYLRATNSENEGNINVVNELEKDVERLNLIADRFSKIGSAPELTAINIFEELEKARDYMEKRAPRKVVFDFPKIDGNPELPVKVNSHLFQWVIENLLRNALDAMDGTGKISAKVEEEKDFISIDIGDTGKGIPASKLKTVFEPGFTTKKRGWGLGLSLAKRIIQSYHSGRIFVKQSVLNEGTTFTIKLPKA